MATAHVTFVAHCNTHGGTLCVTGNTPLLGNWDVAHAVKMSHVPDDPSKHTFSLRIDVPMGTTLQYKYLLMQDHRFVLEKRAAPLTLAVTQTELTQDDGQLQLDDHTAGAELGFLHRAAQLRVYVMKEGSSGPVSRVNLPHHNPEDFVVSVKTDSRSHCHPMEDQGVWVFHLSIQAPHSFHVDCLATKTGELIGRTCISHAELVEKRGTLTRPIIGKDFRAVGELTLSYLVVTPLAHPNNTLDVPPRPFPGPGPLFIGHRGFGSTNNLGNRSHRHKYGIATENTLSSFLAAAKHGARWVEFDVQLTKDNIPVLVHDEDINVKTTSVDGSNVQVRVPVNKLNLEKLRKLRAVMPEPKVDAPTHRRRKSLTDIRDGYSSGSESDSGATLAMPKEWERSLWARLDGYPTLAEMFQHVPPDVGFNVEIKWPDEDTTVAEYALAERNFYVDTILNCIFSHAGNRPIILSSFDPSICLLARHKQLRYPVFFLTAAGWEQFSDSRKQSLEAGISFAKRAGLFGVVSESHAIVAAPILIRQAHDAGLYLLSYGGLNNVPAHVKLQVENGIDAIITDELELIRAELRGKSERPKTATLMAATPSALSVKATS